LWLGRTIGRQRLSDLAARADGIHYATVGAALSRVRRRLLARIFHGRFKIRSEAEPATPKRVKRNAVKLHRDQAWARMSI
jgi:hypothetical protein